MPKTPKFQTIHVKVPTSDYEKLKKIAEADHRTLNNLVFVALLALLERRHGK